MNRSTAMTLAASVAAAVLFASWHASGQMSGDAPRERARPPSPAPDPRTAARGWFSAIPGSPDSAPAAPLPLAQQVDALVASGKPENFYAAHNLIQTCMAFQHYGTVPFYQFPDTREMTADEQRSTAAMCSGMTERMQRSRLDYLAIAAKAGVMGAPTAFLMQGPFGDPSALQTRPDDPLVVEWKQQALEQLRAQAVQGDIGSLSTLWSKHMASDGVIPGDPALAYTYLGALQRIFARSNPGGSNPYATDDFPALGAALTPAQRASADQEAGRIADAARARFEAAKRAGRNS